MDNYPFGLIDLEVVYEFIMPGGNGWDGKEEGAFVPAGVYFYIVYLDDIFGATKAFKGTVTLLR